jgi:hypothetical protein
MINNNGLRHRTVCFPENVVSDVRIIDGGRKLPKPIPVRNKFKPVPQEHLSENVVIRLFEKISNNRSAYQAAMPVRRESLSDKFKTD